MSDEEMTGRLLRLGGMRPDPAPDRERRVRQAFLDECRRVSRARAARRRTAGIAAALAMAAVALIVLRLTRDVTAPVPDIVATVERLEGTAVRRTGSSTPVGIGLGDALRPGDAIEADTTGRVGVRLARGASLRVDRSSRVRLVSASRIQLDAGAVYVDSGSRSESASGSEAQAPGLEIATPFGLVRDVGTQFELRLGPSSLRVRVRSGRVDVHRAGEIASAQTGTELIVERGLPISRQVEPYGQDWAWAEGLAPAFAIEGRSLAAFLEHTAHEQGLTLVYDEPALARETSGIILHGSTAGLSPSDALAIVLKTSGLTHTIANGELRVVRVHRQ